jgi:antitoxin (DNA-binding transcriptional repressor) of toxin-antitoxin stability system
MEERTVITHELTTTGKRELVERVIASPVFSGARTLQAFLLFITNHAIAGQTEHIKEQRIGCEVLGRRPDYDPADDNIVRVRARELRQRLAKYFSTSGAGEPVVITVPSGSYMPVFEPRLPPAQIARPAPWSAWTEAQSAAVRDFWGQFFPEPGGELAVVASDAAFALWQDITGQNPNLGDYLGRKCFDTGDPNLREVAARHFAEPGRHYRSVRGPGPVAFRAQSRHAGPAQRKHGAAGKPPLESLGATV